MLLVYIDESYRRHHEYWLAALAVDDSRVPALCDSIRATSAAIPASFGIPSDVELHGQHLFHGESAFAPLTDRIDLRAKLFRQALKGVRSAGATIHFVGVYWSEAVPARRRLGSHRLAAMQRLLAEIDRHAWERGERCLLIADEEEASTDEVVSAVRSHQAAIRVEGRHSAILDGPLFTPSHHSFGVQACDLIAFLKSRRAFMTSGHDPRARQAIESWWRLISPLGAVDDCIAFPTD